MLVRKEQKFKENGAYLTKWQKFTEEYYYLGIVTITEENDIVPFLKEIRS